MFARFSIFLIIVWSQFSSGATVSNLKDDTEASIVYGDFYRAYRNLSYLEMKKPKHFEEMGVENYLRSVFVIGSKETIGEECERYTKSGDSAKASYLCGLHYIEERQPEKAEVFLKKVSSKTKFYWPAQILLSTGDLVQNNPDQAIKRLSALDPKKFSALNLENQYYLCRARAFAAANRLEDSIKDFQAVVSASPFYIQALEETAWVFFKMRRFESSQILLDVLISNFESSRHIAEDLNVSPSAYYRARYLKAYLELVEQRPEGAVNEFTQLKHDYEKFMDKLKGTLNVKPVLQAIKSENINWPDARTFPPALNEQLTLISEWVGPEIKHGFEKEIHFQMALSREINRMHLNQDLSKADGANYLKLIDHLQNESWTSFSKKYTTAIKKLARNLDTMSLKSELGRLEIFLLNRAQGARTLDEIIDNYRQSVRSIDDFMEK